MFTKNHYIINIAIKQDLFGISGLLLRYHAGSSDYCFGKITDIIHRFYSKCSKNPVPLVQYGVLFILLFL